MNMKTLGFDPGARFVAWAVLDGPRLLDRGCITGPIVKTKKNPAGVEWQRALASILGAVEMRFREVKPELVACEQTQHVAGKRAMSDESRMAQAVATDRTQQIIGGIAVLCERYQVPLVMVHPASSAAALGVKRGATDGEVSAAAKAMFAWEGKWLASDAHEARACGVALRGEKDWRLEQAKARRLVDGPAREGLSAVKTIVSSLKERQQRS